jgi:Transcription initiation factor IID, 18kD subunit
MATRAPLQVSYGATVPGLDAIAQAPTISDALSRCLQVGTAGKVDVADVTFILRKDARKADRAREIVDIKAQTKVFKHAEAGGGAIEEIQGLDGFATEAAEQPGWDGAATIKWV